MTRSKFVIVKHDAKKARLHYDLRFVMPKSKLWASFAVRKGVPTKEGIKVLAVKTHNHTEEEALFFGTIAQGYGAGKLTKWDGGNCIIHKYGPSHISIELQGRKVKGQYHMINIGVMNKRDFKKQSYMLFKGKEPLKEVMGMISLIPRGGIVDDVEASQDELQGERLPWSKKIKSWI